MINLNDNQFDGGGNAKIFNGGKAGVVENVAISVSRKKAEDKPGSPEFKLNFTDETGAVCSLSYWTVEKETSYKSVDQQIQAQGKVFKHILHALYGKTFEIPSFPNPKAMLDGCMKLINDGSKSAGAGFRIIANYGAAASPKSFIQPRSWVPFMEPMSVSIEESRLQLGDFDASARLTKDEIPVGNANDLLSPSTNNDDWE